MISLPEHVTRKESETKKQGGWYVGLSTMKGWRSANEDRHACLFDLAPESGKQVSFFAVLDGHFGMIAFPGPRQLSYFVY